MTADCDLSISFRFREKPKFSLIKTLSKHN